MADKRITELTAVSALVDDDLFPVVQLVSTTPEPRKSTGTLIKSWLKTYFDTLYTPIVGTGQITLLAFQGYPAATAGCSALTIVDSGSNDVNYRVLDFDPTTQEYCHFDFILPIDFDGGTVTAQIIWLANDTTGNAVVWGVQAESKLDDSNMNIVYPTGVEVTDQTSTTGANRPLISATTAAITITSGAASRWTSLRVYRKAADAADTLTTDARLLAVRLIYTKA